MDVLDMLKSWSENSWNADADGWRPINPVNRAQNPLPSEDSYNWHVTPIDTSTIAKALGLAMRDQLMRGATNGEPIFSWTEPLDNLNPAPTQSKERRLFR